MSDLIIACVRTGPRPSITRVRDLRDMVAEHLQRRHTMICLTDQPERCENVGFIDITEMGLRDWGRMALFEPMWRQGSKVIYFDLATIIVGDIAPLADVPGEFARHRFGVMVIGSIMGDFMWKAFDEDREQLVLEHASDHECIHTLYPDAPPLTQFVPKEFFRNAVLTPK
jgi:hypothetical protein